MKKIPRVSLLCVFAAWILLLSTCGGSVANLENRRIQQAVDYQNDYNWAFYNEGKSDGPVDIFLICQTAYRNNEPANMPIDDYYNRDRFLCALKTQMGIYEETGSIYAPYYRQASLSAYTDYESGEDALQFAYGDIRAAFIHFLENISDGRPFIIAGYSQGADMALRLMKEFFVDDKLQERLVAAYIIGWRITREDIKSNRHLHMADNELDTGVIISFNCESIDTDYSLIVPDYTFGINPLNWSTGSEIAPKELAKGSRFFNGDGETEYEVSEKTGAYICPKRGTLKLVDLIPADFPGCDGFFGDGVFHVYDFQLFFKDLQENVAARTAAYIEFHTNEGHGNPKLSSETRPVNILHKKGTNLWFVPLLTCSDYSLASKLSHSVSPAW